MKKLIFLLENILKKINLTLLFLLIFTLYGLEIKSKERWLLDKTLSTITFEVPVLLSKNVKGEFKEIEGLVEIDLKKKQNNKALFSVNTKSVDINYTKYKDLLLSDIFFFSSEYPLAVIDTKKFSYINEKEIKLDVEFSLKGKNKILPLDIYINRLAEELVQIKSLMVFSRNEFNIGRGKWSNSVILKDKVTIKANLFLFKE
tara:strand:- start:1288 stop:1893 length:606 start_codon:yes stop_codon:yes gene_type:complete